MSRALDRSIAEGIGMTKGGKNPLYLHINVCIISRASKGNKIRQENRISILRILTGRNMILLNTKCVWHFLEKDIAPDTLDPDRAKQEKGELKRCLGSGGEKTGRENIAFCMKAFYLDEKQGKWKVPQQTKMTEFCLFMPERAETPGSTDQVCKNFFPAHTCSLWPRGKDSSLGSCAFHFLSFILPPSTSCLHPWNRGDNFPQSGTCQISPALSYRQLQGAIPLAFFKSTPDWCLSFAALCLLPHAFLQLSQHCHRWSQDLCFWRQPVRGCLLLATWKYKIMSFFFTFVNVNRSKDVVLLTAPEEIMPQWQASFQSLGSSSWPVYGP